MLCPIDLAARKNPKQTAIVDGRQALSYGWLNQQVNLAAGQLYRRRISRGTRVGLTMAKEVGHIITLFALFRCQAVAVLFNSRQPLPEHRRQLKQAGVKILVSAWKKNSADRSSAQSPFSYHLSPRQDATILFTSGSTHEPKAVLHTLGSHRASAQNVIQSLRINSTSRWMLALPLHHVGGLSILFRMFMAGGTVILCREQQHLRADLRRSKTTHVSLVTTQLKRLLDRNMRGSDVPALKAIILGGSPVPHELLKKALTHRLPVRLTYGMTETASQIALSKIIKHRCDFSKAKLLPGVHWKIGKEGEIGVRGACVMRGYIRHGKLQPNKQWFLTGDLGKVTAGGELSILGRRDNMFISGGENIHPEEIEHYLLLARGIEKAVVVPQPDSEFGFRPVAFIKTTREYTINKNKIEEELVKNLPKFKKPITYLAWPTHLEKSSLKLQRRQFKNYLATLCREHQYQ